MEDRRLREPVESLAQFKQALNLTLPPLDLTSAMISSATGIHKKNINKSIKTPDKLLDLKLPHTASYGRRGRHSSDPSVSNQYLADVFTVIHLFSLLCIVRQPCPFLSRLEHEAWLEFSASGTSH